MYVKYIRGKVEEGGVGAGPGTIYTITQLASCATTNKQFTTLSYINPKILMSETL